jgi:hypothetical protein
MQQSPRREGEHRRHPRGEGSTGEGENGAKSALRNGLNDRRGNEGRNVRIERLGWVKREEVGEEAGGVGRSHGGTRDGVGGVSVPIQVERMFKPKVRCVRSLLS